MDLDDDVLQAARELAASRKTTIGRVISELARRSLLPPVEAGRMRNDVPLLARRADTCVVTMETVNRLRDEGIAPSR